MDQKFHVGRGIDLETLWCLVDEEEIDLSFRWSP